MKVKLYEYPKCSTCRKAVAFLDGLGVPYEKINIVESPPTKSELLKMLSWQNGELKKLFNTSGELYREMKMSQRLSSLKADEAIEILASHGKLVKRPFVVTGSDGLVGFDEARWRKCFESNL